VNRLLQPSLPQTTILKVSQVPYVHHKTWILGKFTTGNNFKDYNRHLIISHL
jgi:hypothetical protein